MPLVADRVQDTCTSPGTGNVTLSGTAPTGKQAFSAVYSAGDQFSYCIQDQSGGNWEVGIATLLTSTTFSRDTVTASSNSGAKTNFSTGTQDVFVDTSAALININGIGVSLALQNNWALP